MLSASLDLVTTPCLVLDRARLARNLSRFGQRVAHRGVTLRPHLKTAKSLDIAHLAVPDRSGPIAVSTLHEAEYFSAGGYGDIFYTGGIGPGKIGRVAHLRQQGVNLMVCLDDLATAKELAARARTDGIRLRVAVEVDCGEHRGGIAPDSAPLIPLARALGDDFAGVTTHAGHSYSARSEAELTAIARQEVEAVRTAVGRLSSHGLACRTVSIGSSPTALTTNDLAGVTEMRAGVYMFGDLFQAGIGTCSQDDIALSVLTEVISHPSDRTGFIIDAGAFALSKDMATAALPPAKQAGFGLLADIAGTVIPGLKVTRVWQEHGLVTSDRPLPANSFPVGSRLRVFPNHACPTAAAYDRYHVVDGDTEVAAIWPRTNGW